MLRNFFHYTSISDDPPEYKANEQSKFPLRPLSIVSIISFFGLLLALYSNTSVSPIIDTKSILPSPQHKQTEKPLYFTVDNSYTRKKALYTEYPWEIIVEPFKGTTFYAVNGVETSIFNWIILDSDEKEIGRMDGSQPQFVFTQVGQFLVQLTETLKDSSKINQYETSVISKYVRREIRDLTDEDREKFFSAFETIAKVSMDEGISLYGEKYRDKDYFNKKHAGDYPDCSHFHKGASFLPTHVALTLEFEQSLQSIDPSISVPYWDYTIDDYLFGENWRNSPIFDGDWFGTPSPTNADHVVDSGRWAYFPVKSNAWNYSTMHNSYGMLTEPWNNNPSPYLTRSDTLFGVQNTQRLPSCEDHQKCLQMENWMDFTFCIENDAHENVHQLIGGVFDTNNVLTTLYEANPQYADKYLEIASRADRTIQTFITAGWLQCPDQCDISTPYSECKCSCEVFKDGVPDTFVHIFEDKGLLDNLDYFKIPQISSKSLDKEKLFVEKTSSGGSEPQSKSEQQEITESINNMVEFYCDPGKIGDMYGSMATNDITFWPIHPTLERIWAWQRLQNNPHYDQTWVFEDPSTGCEGHDPDDIMPWSSLLNEGNDVLYKNSDLYIMFDPKNPNLPYLYDNFEWPHCETAGFKISYSSDRLISSSATTQPIKNNRDNFLSEEKKAEEKEPQEKQQNKNSSPAVPVNQNNLNSHPNPKLN